MAVNRTPPQCPKCGKRIYAIYKDQSGLPPAMQLIGDTFIKWDWEGHKCEENCIYPPVSGSLLKVETAAELMTRAKEIPDTLVKNPSIFLVMERRDGAILTWNTTLDKPLKDIMNDQRKRCGKDVKFTEGHIGFELNGEYQEFPLDMDKVT